MDLIKRLTGSWGSGLASTAPFDHTKAFLFLVGLKETQDTFDVVDKGTTIEVVGEINLSNQRNIPSLSGVHVRGDLSIDSHLRDKEGGSLPAFVSGRLDITDEGPPAQIDTDALRDALVHTGPPPRKLTP